MTSDHARQRSIRSNGSNRSKRFERLEPLERFELSGGLHLWQILCGDFAEIVRVWLLILY